jgi:hypothetical protein
MQVVAVAEPITVAHLVVVAAVALLLVIPVVAQSIMLPQTLAVEVVVKAVRPELVDLVATEVLV